MSDYFFGRFADLVDPVFEKKEIVKTTRMSDGTIVYTTVEKERVKELKSNFLNKYIYSFISILILLIVAIFYFVSR